jgi:hypothetical protein
MNFTGVPLTPSSSDPFFVFLYLPANTGNTYILVIGSNSINRWPSIGTNVCRLRPMNVTGVQLMFFFLEGAS